MNTFCKECAKNNTEDIRFCEFKFCPFYAFRFTDIDHEDDIEIAEKLLGAKDG